MSTPSEKIALSSSLHGCTESTTVKPKSLPDVDDVSMSRVTNYMQQYREDVYWSFLSDSFFIAGGICYVLLAVPVLNENPSVYLTVLEFIAPTVYLLNSCIDVKWAQITKERSRARNEMTETWSYWRIMLEMEPNSFTPTSTSDG